MILGLNRGECLLNLVQRGGEGNIQSGHTGTIVAGVYGGVCLMEGFPLPLGQRYWLSACPFHIWVALRYFLPLHHSRCGCGVALVRIRTPHVLVYSALLSGETSEEASRKRAKLGLRDRGSALL